MLNRLDLGCLVASSPEEYVNIAVCHAREPEFLAATREGLREKMRATWTDAAAYTAELESHFREMLARTGLPWHCDRQRVSCVLK